MVTSTEAVPESLVIDFDIVADPALHEDPQARLMDVFKAYGRDITYSPHNGGHWIITSHRLAHEVLCDAKRFG